MQDIKKIIQLHFDMYKEKQFNKKIEIKKELDLLKNKRNISNINREFFEWNYFIYKINSEWIQNNFKIDSFKKLNIKIDTLIIL